MTYLIADPHHQLIQSVRATIRYTTALLNARF